MSNINVLVNKQWKPMATEEYVDTKISGITSGTSGTSTSDYFNVVNKPYEFNGKTALFFGDSITQGHTGSGVTAENFVKLFSERVGLTTTNKGVGGSSFSYEWNSIKSIVDTIKATTLDKDFVFIAGGINDWQTGATAEQLQTALTDLCEYLKENCTVPVIFITPINHGGWGPCRTPQMTVKQVRNIISFTALKYGYDLVLGENFNFPLAGSDLVSVFYGDKLHPSLEGHKLYAKALANAVC